MLRATLLILFGMFFAFNASANDYQEALDAADDKKWSYAKKSARNTGNRALQEYVQWRRLKDSSSRPLATDILDFIESHPHWPDMDTLTNRAGEALLLEGMPTREVRQWAQLAKKHKDLTISSSAEQALLKERFVHGRFNKSEQNQIIESYRDNLRNSDYEKRVDELLWKKQSSLASSLFPYISKNMRKLANARIALMKNQRNVNTAIDAVPKRLRSHPALLYERIQWRYRKKLASGVEELLRAAPNDIPHASKWWKIRAYYVREAIEQKDYEKAFKLLKNHGQTGGAALADALWLRGWIQLHFLNNPRGAYKDFYQLAQNVSYPISVSRGAYWAGKAAKENRNHSIAKNWYKIAAEHGTSFYGQLAQLALNKGLRLDIKAASTRSHRGTIRHGDRRIKEVITLMAKYNQKSSLRKFVHHLAKQQNTTEGFTSLGLFAADLGHPELMVQTGKKASQLKHFWLPKISHPLRKVPHKAIEPALALAITRQESEFNPKAQSHANAIGMMQLLPATAKHTAKRHDIAYSYRKLTSPDYNMTLGIHYLAGLLDRYDGSYPLAIAAYNAGPGNVNRWLERFGHPQEGLDGHLKWIERIPFTETRNYVQRVLENLQTYRHLLGERKGFTEQRALGQ